MLSRGHIVMCSLGAAFDAVTKIKTTRDVFSNLKSIGLSTLDSIVKTFLFYRSKRMSASLNNAILTRSDALPEFLKKNVTFSHPHYWQQCLRHGGPVLLVTPHYGPFAVGCLKATMDMYGIRSVNAFYDPPEKNSSTAEYKAILSALGKNFNPIFNNRKGLVSAMRALRNNEALTMMPDVFEINNQTVYVPFLEYLTCAMTGTAFLARKSSALILTAYVRVDGSQRIVIDLDAPYQMAISDNEEEDLYRQTAIFMASLETQLRLYPEHWMYLPNLPSRLISRYTKNPSDISMKIRSLSRSLNLQSGKKL